MSRNRGGPNKGVGIGRAKRQRIIEAWGGRCWLCGSKPGSITLDHVVPRKEGGTIHASNLRPACESCNLQRDRRLRKLTRSDRRQRIATEVEDLSGRLFDPVQADEAHILARDRA